MLQYANLGLPHAGILWPVNRAAAVSPTRPALRGANHIFNRGQPFTQTLAVTTNAGDCILIAVWANGATSDPTGSGAGATWVTYAQADHQSALIVGYNCSAGQTTCTVTAPGGSSTPAVPGLNIDVSVWSGIRSASNPVIGSPNLTQIPAPSGLTIVSGSVSYSTNDLVFGAAISEDQLSTYGAGIWSNGATNNRTNIGAQYVAGDYIIPTTSGSTTLTEQSGSTATKSIILAVLSNSP